MKRLKILMLAVAFMFFGNTVLFAVDKETTVLDQTKTGPEREEYVVSKLKSYFQRNQNFRQLKSGAQQKPGREITLLLKEAAQNYDSWSDEAREYVQMFLKRPTDTSNAWPWDGEPSFYLPAPVLSFEPDVGTYPAIGDKFKFWYVTHTDADGGGTSHETNLDYVKTMASAFDTVYATTINTMGYPVPPDDSAASDNGGDSKLDIYVMDCGAYNIYGYTVSEGSGSSSPSFMVMDNDYSEFLAYNDTEEEAMQVTAAHEFHHVIQFGINIDASAWIMEATSTWMEDQVYDDIDDNLQYLNSSVGFFLNPHQSIDSEFQWYNSWILLEYMETKWDQDTVKNIWLNYLTIIDDGTTAVVSAIEDEGDSFQTAFKDFSTVNFDQQGFYTNHSLYNTVYISNEASGIGYNLGYTSASSNIFESGTIAISHLATQYFKLTPGTSTGTGDEDKLTIYINGSNGRKIDVIPIITSADNNVTQEPISLDSSNDGTLVVDDFNRSSISSIVFVLVNYSTNEEGSTFSLRGGLGVDGAANDTPDAISSSSSSSSGGCFIDSLR